MSDIKIVRQEGVYSLCKKKTETNNTVFWIDNEDEVSEYMDEFDCEDLINCSSDDFINKCLELL